jgi:hypothetical protein
VVDGRSSADKRDFSRLKLHLEPIARATNIAQGNSARLDTILLTLACLWRVFSTPGVFDEEIVQAVLASIARRWADTDQDVFILAVLLNPYIRTSVFHPSSKWSDENDSYLLFEKLYKRLVNSNGPPPLTRLEWQKYIRREKGWSDESMMLEHAKDEAQAQVRVRHSRHVPFLTLVVQGLHTVNLLTVWQPFNRPDRSPQRAAIAGLALRILSCVANSAGMERDWSKFNVYNNKLRNRLHHDCVRKMVIIDGDITTRYAPPPRPSRKRAHTVACTASGDHEARNPDSGAGGSHDDEGYDDEGSEDDDSDEDDSADADHADGSARADDARAGTSVDEPDAATRRRRSLRSFAAFLEVEEASDDAPEYNSELPPVLVRRSTMDEYLIPNLFPLDTLGSIHPSARNSLKILDSFWESGASGLAAEVAFHEHIVLSQSRASTVHV